MKPVSTEILDRTTDCDYEFACLDGNPLELCEADFITEDNLVFLKSSPGKPSCNYWSGFGESGICRCPVRVELFRRQGI